LIIFYKRPAGVVFANRYFYQMMSIDHKKSVLWFFKTSFSLI